MEQHEVTTLAGVPFGVAERSPESVLFRREGTSGWEDVTAAAFAHEVERLGAAFLAAGVEVGDRVVLLSRTRYEWTLVDYALWSVGAVGVPVYESSSTAQVAWILEDSGARLAVVESERHAQTVAEARRGDGGLEGTWCIQAGDLTRRAAGVGEERLTALRERRRSLSQGDPATIVYTSGTTGRPKGCVLTHENLLGAVRAGREALADMFQPGESTVLFLPLAHVFARLLQCVCVESEVTVTHCPEPAGLVALLPEAQPSFLVSVPRIFEKVHAGAKSKAEAAGKGGVFARAEQVAIAYSEGLERGRVPLWTRAQHALFERLVYSRIRSSLGGKVRHAVSGGAPLGQRLGHFFRGAGIPVYEGYGLTETTACSTINTPGATRVGSVGRVVKGLQVRLEEDGEILFSGPSVFPGYWRNDEASAEVLSDGWFRTGDLGTLDEEGYLTITGRKKEILVTAGGKNVAPAPLEDEVRAHQLVSQCVVVGDQRPYVAALVTLDTEALAVWAKAHGRAGLDPSSASTDPEVLAEVQRAVDSANSTVSSAEAIRRFVVLPVDLTEEGGHLTPTLKVKRSVVAAEFAEEVEGLYAPTLARART